MEDPIELIVAKLNLENLPQVYADQAPQGSTLPYIVVSRVNPQLDRYFGGVIQKVDFQIKQYYIKYSQSQMDAAKIHNQTIEDTLELQHFDATDNCRITHKIAPYRVNIEDDNNFNLVQTWNFYYEE